MVAHSIIDQCLFEQAAQWAWGNVMKCQHDMSSYEGRIILSAEPLDPSVCLLQSKNTAWIDLIHQEFVKPRSDKLTLTRRHNWSNIEDHGWKFLQNLQKQAEVWQTAGNISFFQYWYHAQGTYSEIVIRRGKSIRGMESALRCRSVTPYRSCTRITRRNENTENRKKFMRRLGVTKWRDDGKRKKKKNREKGALQIQFPVQDRDYLLCLARVWFKTKNTNMIPKSSCCQGAWSRVLFRPWTPLLRWVPLLGKKTYRKAKSKEKRRRYLRAIPSARSNEKRPWRT